MICGQKSENLHLMRISLITFDESKEMAGKTFIVDCPYCKAKVAADVFGVAESSGRSYDSNKPYADRLYVGKCPRCETLLAGESHQTAFMEWGAEFDEWSDVVRLYPKPTKTFSSHRIPHAVSDSLAEGDRSLQAGAHTAACVMFGRALEAVCRNLLQPSPPAQGRVRGSQWPINVETSTPTKKIMLAQGIRELKDSNFIDQRLYDWSQQLKAFRDIAAHPDDISISRQDAEDLQTFVYAIVEYIYDLTDRYEEFKKRLERKKKKA
jgi:hypothetical protein